MTKLEAIHMIGDIITEIDIARGSLLPQDPNRLHLDDLRLLLDDRQRQLSKAVFSENTKHFQDAAQRVQEINSQMKGTIKHVKDLETVLQNIQRFLDAVTTLITAIRPIV
jgi:hypothetical protein